MEEASSFKLFSDYENMSDLESLMNLIEDEDEFIKSSEGKSDEKRESEDESEDGDCEIISVSTGFERIKSITFNVSSNVSNSLKQIPQIPFQAKQSVQKSISEFFKKPKPIPEAEVEIVVKEDKMAKIEKPFTFPPLKKDIKEEKEIKFERSSHDRKFKVPKFKIIPETSFAVDAFNYGPIEGISAYFLTHFHSDHYKGLCNKFLEGSNGGSMLRLYCSEVTGNLVQKELKIRKEFIRTLKIGRMYSIEGIKVGVFDANQ